jgi:hypothetical protein
MGIKGYRPHQVLVEFPIGADTPTRVAGVICYDATDLALVADLRDRSDMLLITALNQDVDTFDNMVAALRFHMYQPVILANMGEFGGSTAQAPLPRHERLISHVHGGNQVTVSVFEIDSTPFKTASKPKPTPPQRNQDTACWIQGAPTIRGWDLSGLTVMCGRRNSCLCSAPCNAVGAGTAKTATGAQDRATLVALS